MNRAIKGSQYHLQELINLHPAVLDQAIGLPGITWVSPLDSKGYEEFQDDAFINALGLSLQTPLKDFWPANGPCWDALGKTEDGTVILVEAKSHIPEMFSECKATSPKSINLIQQSLKDTQQALKSNSNRDWTQPFYQYANRLAHAYFLEKVNEISTRLVFLHFVGDKPQKGPDTREEWEAAITVLHEALGLTGRIPRYVQDVFINVSNTPYTVD